MVNESAQFQLPEMQKTLKVLSSMQQQVRNCSPESSQLSD